jgi:hypothetical protein
MAGILPEPKGVAQTFFSDTTRFISESQRFLSLNCANSRLNFYDAQRLLLFGFATCALATLGSRPMIAGKTTIRPGGGNPALAIRINLVQPGCNRSVLKQCGFILTQCGSEQPFVLN